MLIGSGDSEMMKGKNWLFVNSPKRLHWLFGKLQDSPEFSFDIETNHPTTGLQIPDMDVVIGCMSFCWKENEAACLPLFTGFERNTFWSDPKIFSRVIDRVGQALEGPAEKIAQNGKFDVKWIWKVLDGIKVANFNFDTMLAHHLLDEEGKLTCRHGLKVMAEFYLDPKAKQYAEALDKALDYYDAKYRRYTSVPYDILSPYSCSDSDYTLQLKKIFLPQLEEQGLLDLYYDEVLPLAQTCMFAEIRGMNIDLDRHAKVADYLQAKRSDVEGKIYECVGSKFDVTSPQQVAKVLYEDLKLPVQTKNSRTTTDANAMKALEGKHPIIEFLHEYRNLSVLENTFVTGIFERLQSDGCIHPDFLVHGTKTGRLATQNPNVQNMPKPEKGGSLIKGMFIAAPGTKWLSADYSQIELRCAADLAKEPVWIEAFKNGFDAHSATAKKCWNLPCEVEEVKTKFKEFRSRAKTVNFGILYGQSSHGLAQELGMTPPEAAKFIEGYFNGLNKLKVWIDDTHEFATKNGYVVNPFGRRRRLPDVVAWVPPSQRKPQGAPACWSKKDEVPPLIKLQHGLDLRSNLHLVNETSFWQQQVSQVRNQKYDHCKSCPAIGSCIFEDEHRKVEGRIRDGLRQAGNAIVQSYAAGLAFRAFAKIIVVARQNGIPLALASDVAGICPMNFVHDDLIFQINDEYVDQTVKLMKETMVSIRPEMLVPLEADVDVVDRWSECSSKEDVDFEALNAFREEA